jgi:hypothetical protein
MEIIQRQRESKVKIKSSNLKCSSLVWLIQLEQSHCKRSASMSGKYFDTYKNGTMQIYP